MTKQAFLSALQIRLKGLPEGDVEGRLNFYGEMIDDRMEEGMTEEEAVAALGAIDGISAQIIADIPLAKIARERVKPQRRLALWEILLLAIGSPLWLSLAAALLGVILSVYAVLWSLVVSAWAIFAALCASAPAGVASAAVFAALGHPISAAVLLAASLVCAGLAILSFFGCVAATKGTVLLTRKIALRTKKCFIRKERAQ